MSDASTAVGHPSVMLQLVSCLLPAPLIRVCVSVSLGVLGTLARPYMLQHFWNSSDHTSDATFSWHCMLALPADRASGR